MSESRILRLKALFDEALELPPERRADFVSERCGDDAALAAELEGLLAAHTRAGGIEASISAAAESLVGAGSDRLSAEGRRIGAYRVIGEVGRGGMGRVYLAERDDAQYAGRVAIKLLAPGAAGTEGAERIRNECQVLADLRHPNIAQLLDAGTTEEGQPYLVIEYVEGEPIDRYCDAHSLPVTARIALFLKLCDAVEHAHRNLIIHRDIKASNVLVTAEGEPKLLDFGIAKLLDLERARMLDLHLTGDVSRLLTPATASPEQLRGEPVNTATDVYQLGHLLYRLITGGVPYKIETGDRFAMPRAILDEEPTRPSLVVREAAGAARARATTPDRLARRLSGDLDAIVLKTLRKNAAERYSAPRELAEDLQRYLEHRPVSARGETLGYVTRRFVARNRGAVAGAATVIVLVASLVAFYTIQLAAERDRARTEARRAEEVATFLTDIFDVATPDESRGAEITAREILDRGAERIGVQLRSEPTVQASLMRAIGSAYGKLGHFEQATEVLQQALATREALGGDQDDVLGDALQDLGVVLLIQARYPEAEAMLARALAVRRNVHGAVHADMVESLLSLASLAHELAEFERVAAYLTEAASIVQALEPAEPLLLADVLLANGDLLNELGDYEAAIADYRQCIALRIELLGEDHPATLLARNNLTDALTNSGRTDEAIRILRENLEIRRRVLPPDHPDLAQALANLSASLKNQGRSSEAVALQEQALEIYRAAHPGDHPDVAVALNNLANLRHDLRDLDAALELHNAALAMNRRLYGDDHPVLAANYNNLAALQADRGDFAGALELYERTLELDARHLGEEHPFVGLDRIAVGSMEADLGRIVEAEATLRQALDENRRSVGADHPYTFNAMRELGRLLQQEGRCEEAEPMLANALQGLERHYPGDPWEVAVTRSHLGACRAATDPTAGEQLMRQGYERLAELNGPDHRLTTDAREVLAEFLRGSDRGTAVQ